jgi:hypothetical protein|tara:strand:+ start:397 stop:837 length:441 start_codon:yes stop_codon:yes gene_type:complete
MSSLYNGLVALDNGNQRCPFQGKTSKPISMIMLRRGEAGQADSPNEPMVILNRLLDAKLPKGTVLNPYNFNVIAFNTNATLKSEGKSLTIDHVRAVVKKLGDDIKVWVSPCYNSRGVPPKLNIAKASETSKFSGRKSTVKKFNFGY